jgi:CBS domain-containing protein
VRAKDVMSSPVHTIAKSESVERAAELMTVKSVTALPVVDESGALVGMVSDSDLLWHRVPADPTGHLRQHPDTDPENRPDVVGEVMSAFPLTTRPETDLAEVAEAMLQNDVRSIPVIEDDRVVGIVSRRDILRAVVRGDDVLAQEIQHRLDEYGDAPRRWMAAVKRGVATVTGDFDDDTERAIVAVLARTVPGVAAAHIDSIKAS